MDLKLKDLVKLLGVQEKLIRKWIAEKKIPYYEVQHQYRFSNVEIREWALSNSLLVSPNVFDSSQAKEHVSLTALIKRGGVHRKIRGSSPVEVLRNAVDALPPVSGLNAASILSSLLKREELMPTALGRGFAIPHPRNPLVTNPDGEMVALCVLDEPIDYGSIDCLPVRFLFIVLSAAPKRHLEILSKIALLCSSEGFSEFLAGNPEDPPILAFIAGMEEGWRLKKPAGGKPI